MSIAEKVECLRSVFTLLFGPFPFPDKLAVNEIKHIEPQKRKIRIDFTKQKVIINEKSENKITPFLLAEYIILKGQKVHWLWASVILKKFKPKNPREQFKNYIYKNNKILRECGLHIEILKDEENNFAELVGIDDMVVSNIKKVKNHYKEALLLYDNGKILDAIKELNKITQDKDHNWYTFKDSYLNLAKWICELNFEKISEELIQKCGNFLKWYSKKLKIGISRIEEYTHDNELETESKDEFRKIKKELEKVENLYKNLISRIPISYEDEAYEKLVDLLIDYKNKLFSINENNEVSVYTKEDYSIRVIKELEKKNKHFAQVIKDGRDSLWEIIQVIQTRSKRKEFGKQEIQDNYEAIYCYVAELIIALECFDEFECQKGNKLAKLKHYFCSGLRKKLEDEMLK